MTAHAPTLPAPWANVDVTSAAFKANPYPFYARLRAEAPVLPLAIPPWRRVWLVTRYDDVQALLKDDVHFSKNRRHAGPDASIWLPPMFNVFEQGLLSIDGADHDRLKALVHKAFTPRMIEQMRDQVQALANTLLDAIEARGIADLIQDYALPLPLVTIGRIMGVPPADNDKFHRWTRAFLSLGSGRGNMIGAMVTTVPQVMQLARYLRRLIAQRRHTPTDDLTSALVRAQEGDDRLSDDEIVSMLFLLLSAGHETTVNLIASGVLALLEHPDQWARLRDEPTLMRPAIEELLRVTTPAEMATERYALKDVTIAGVTIPKGSLVLGVIASANRDENVFANPDVVDITREPNKHLSFGHGIHYCLGAPLARLEAQIAINTLIARMPRLRLRDLPSQLRWRGGVILRGMEALPVVV